MKNRTFYSRLARKEEQRSLKKATFFGILTIILLVTLAFFGTSALVQLSLFLSDVKKDKTPIEQKDNLPLLAPKINFLPEYTKDPVLVISGFSKPDSMVEVFLNNSSVGTTTATREGLFGFEKVSLVQGKNEIYATATDKTGKKSPSSEKLITFFDNTPPELEISQPLDGSIVGERKRKIKITGHTEDKVSLTINERLIVLGPDGSFSTDFSLSNGDNSIKVIATDFASNQTEKEIKINFRP